MESRLFRGLWTTCKTRKQVKFHVREASARSHSYVVRWNSNRRSQFLNWKTPTFQAIALILKWFICFVFLLCAHYHGWFVYIKCLQRLLLMNSMHVLNIRNIHVHYLDFLPYIWDFFYGISPKMVVCIHLWTPLTCLKRRRRDYSNLKILRNFVWHIERRICHKYANRLLDKNVKYYCKYLMCLAYDLQDLLW